MQDVKGNNWYEGRTRKALFRGIRQWLTIGAKSMRGVTQLSVGGNEVKWTLAEIV